MNDQLKINCGPADQRGVRLFTATLGDKTHGPDKFDPDIASQRRRFREQVIATFGFHDGDAHGPIEELILEAANRQDKFGSEIVEYRRISSKELSSGDYTVEYLIENTLVAGQPLIIAGPEKTLKTSFIIDAAVSLATGGHFLGRLPVKRACRVAVMTGESGLATIQETALRVCVAAGKWLDEIDSLVWSPDLPKFGSVAHANALERFLTNDEIEVLFIDPAYLCMPSADAGNVMAQGELLRSMSDVCNRVGTMMVLAHHTKGRTDSFQRVELSDIAWAGFKEFARQWWLLSRREKYEPGTGEHKLWLNIGGSAGHSALWAVDVAEGVRSETTERKWDVDLKTAADAQSEAEEAQHDYEELKRLGKVKRRTDADKRKIVDSMHKLTLPETATTIRNRTALSSERFNLAISELLADAAIVEADVQKSNRKMPYPGFNLVYQDSPESTYQTNGTNHREHAVP